jgi:lipopolysaccharide transport protein LptA
MYRTLYSLLIIIPIATQGFAPALLAAEERISGLSSGDTLTIRSPEARMDEEPNIFHFEGGFELRATDWYLSSDHATLYGKLDDPETVVISGSPAQILVNTISNGQATTINGHAERIVYQRRSNSIRMEGNAFISRNEHSMSGGEIEYDIEQDHLSAGGDGGVHIEVKPNMDSQKKSRG